MCNSLDFPYNFCEKKKKSVILPTIYSCVTDSILNERLHVAVSSLAISSLSSFKALGWIPYGPGDLLLFITSKWDMWVGLNISIRNTIEGEYIESKGNILEVISRLWLTWKVREGIQWEVVLENDLSRKFLNRFAWVKSAKGREKDTEK